jgi:hypothetical protein
VAQYECRTLIVTQADVSFLPLHRRKIKLYPYLRPTT